MVNVLPDEIVKRLEEQNNTAILKTLSDAVIESDRKEESCTRYLKTPLVPKNAGEESSLIKSFLT